MGVQKTGRQQIPNNRLKETDQTSQTIPFLLPRIVNVWQRNWMD